MKIILIFPKTDARPFGMFNVPPYGAVMVATVLKKQGYDITIKDEQIKDIKIKGLGDADVLIVSATTPNIDRGYELARKFKKAFNKPVIFGGIHVTALPKEALENGADIAVVGEAEITIVKIIKNLDKILKLPKEKRIIKGELVKDLDSLPFPDYDLIEGFKTGLAWPGVVSVVPVMPFRGCVNRCPFCASWKIGGLRYRSPESFKKELQYLLDKGFFVFYCGSDYFSWNKKKAAEILRVMKELNIKEKTKGFMIQDSVKMVFDKEGEIDHDYLDLMREAGVLSIGFGIESFKGEAFKEFTGTTGKRQSASEAFHALEAVKEHKMNPYSFLMAGADSQTEEEIIENAKICSGFGAGQVPILTPFPGTVLYEQLKKQDKILFDGPGYWRYYDTLNVVFKHPTISEENLRKATATAWREFFSYKKAVKYFFKAIGNLLLFRGQRFVQNAIRIVPSVIGERTARIVESTKIKKT